MSCRNYVYSEDYVEYILPCYGNLEKFQESYRPDCFQSIGGGLAVLFRKGNYEDEIPINGKIPQCYGLLDTSNIESTGVGQIRRQPYLGFRGNGVLVGVLDTGIDYTYPAFLNGDGTTRIAAIWDQTAQQQGVRDTSTIQVGDLELDPFTCVNDSSMPYFYGTEYTREQINEALRSDNPYDIVPQRDENGHGTAMTGIIAGNEIRRDNFSGVAPLATLVIVKLKQAKKNLQEYYGIREETPCFQETDIFFGIYYLLSKARKLNMPMVIYFGVGTNQGSHTGDSLLCNYLEYFSGIQGINFVAAAGNETNRGHHTYYSFEEGVSYKEIELRIAEGEQRFSFEIWVNSTNLFSLGIISPAGEFTGKIPMTANGTCYESNLVLERVKICTRYHIFGLYSSRQLIFVRFSNVVPGTWRLRIYNEGSPGSFHIWLPMHGFIEEDTRFLAPVPETVICDPGNGEAVLTIGAYNHNNLGIYLYSSRGYTANGQIKPDLVSAGVDITAPDIMGGYTSVTGTSVAAAHVAGMSAILWEWGIVEGFAPRLTGGDIKRLLIMGADRSGFSYPNRQSGYGIANIARAFDLMRKPLE